MLGLIWVHVRADMSSISRATKHFVTIFNKTCNKKGLTYFNKIFSIKWCFSIEHFLSCLQGGIDCPPVSKAR